MRLPRNLTGWLALGAWLYSWSLFAEVRNEFLVADGSPPVWILGLLGFTTTALIAAAATAWMKFWFWPVIAMVAGLAFAASVVGTQFATMRIVTDAVTLSDAFNAALRARSAAGVVLVTAAPSLLLLAGAAGLVRGNRHQIRETVDV